MSDTINIGNCPTCNHFPTQFIDDKGKVVCREIVNPEPTPVQGAREFYAKGYEFECEDHEHYMDFAEAYHSFQSNAEAEKKAELEGYATRLVDHLKWALDIMAMYEKRLIQFGDPKEQVHSFVHINRRNDALSVLEGTWQLLNENSECSYCRSGNIPLEGMHRLCSGNERCAILREP